MTQTLLRHGDRSAQNDAFITKEADAVFFRGAGELTTDGSDHARLIGQAYRQVYVKNYPFLDGRLAPKEAKFRATDVDRVLMTASSFSSGLFQDDGKSIPAPVFTMPYADDDLLAVDYSCRNGWDDVAKRYNITDTTDMTSKLLTAMRASEWQCSDPPSSQSDTIIAEFANPITKKRLTVRQQNCANTTAPQFMYKYIALLGGSGTNDTDARVRFQRSIGRLANQTIDNFNKMIQCYAFNDGSDDSQPKCDPFEGRAIFNAAHDVNLLALLNVFSMQQGALDFFKGNTPAYGSSLVMELWVRRGQFFTKFFVKNGAGSDFEEFKVCDFLPTGDDFPRVGRFCTVKALEKAKNYYINVADFPCEK